MNSKNEVAVFGGGCFWCTEAAFGMLRGVKSVMPGYAGGTVPNPSYEAVCSGKTGHAEVARVEFDPKEISFKDLLAVFFTVHDPTTLNRQGNDVGTQYRSAVFYASDAQKNEAEAFIQKLADERIWEHPIVTEVKPLKEFYPAEDYHRDYFKNHADAPYCSLVIDPKIQKLKRSFAHLLKS